MTNLPKRKSLTPQQKKAASYLKDRRNTYGENDKASRKNIPKSKALSHRKIRKLGKVDYRKVTDKDFDTISKLPKPIWKKLPDTPLGAVLERGMNKDILSCDDYTMSGYEKLAKKRVKKIGNKS